MLLGILLSTFAFAGELYQECEWETVPSIEICPDSKLEIVNIVESLTYWSKRGVKINISGIYNVDYCDLEKVNVIQISGYRNFDNKNYHAMTNIDWYYYDEKSSSQSIFIDRVLVQIPNNKINKEIIVLHEIGHAFGLGHSHDSIMQENH